MAGGRPATGSTPAYETGRVVERRSKRGLKPELDDRVVGVTVGVQVEV